MDVAPTILGHTGSKPIALGHKDLRPIALGHKDFSLALLISASKLV